MDWHKSVNQTQPLVVRALLLFVEAVDFFQNCVVISLNTLISKNSLIQVTDAIYPKCYNVCWQQRAETTYITTKHWI